MWRCSQCDESVEDTFDVCWNCGASGEGSDGSDSDDTAVSAKDADMEAHPDPVDAPSQSFRSGGMSRREFAALICKTLALIMFAVATVLSVRVVVLSVFILLMAPYGPPHATDWYPFLETAVPMLALVGIGVFHWTKSEWIASQLVPDDPRPVAIPPFTVQDVMVVVFSTTGLYFFLQGIRETVRVVYLVQTYSTADSNLGFEYWPPIIQLTLAAWFILGSRGIVGAIHWCRTAGIPQPDDGAKDNRAE